MNACADRGRSGATSCGDDAAVDLDRARTAVVAGADRRAAQHVELFVVRAVPGNGGSGYVAALYGDCKALSVASASDARACADGVNRHRAAGNRDVAAILVLACANACRAAIQVAGGARFERPVAGDCESIWIRDVDAGIMRIAYYVVFAPEDDRGVAKQGECAPVAHVHGIVAVVAFNRGAVRQYGNVVPNMYWGEMTGGGGMRPFASMESVKSATFSPVAAASHSKRVRGSG